ncbi:MAG TPA: cupredoxin domain-containing protein [Candidatus Gracilibacteria bacterium]|nr:cupredoxin domain-containing protein [Candidatus Gracilibacteria bacterium]
MKKLATLLFSIIFLTSFTACQKVEDWEKQKTPAVEEQITEQTEDETKPEEEISTEETTPSTEENSATEDPQSASEIQPTEESQPVQETKTFNITARQFEFSPNTISVNEGDKVVVNLTSEDVAHGFAITEYAINETAPAGTTRIIEFTANKKGTFTFRCPVPCGEGHADMVGNLIVN